MQLWNPKLIGIVAVVVLAGCDQKPVPLEQVMPPPKVKPSKVTELLLSPQSIGRIRFGTPLAQAETMLGEQAMRLDQTDNPECSFVAFKAMPKVRFMVESGVVTRADVEKEIANTAGVRIGDTEDQVRQKIPNAKVGPHKYVPAGHVFTVPGEGKSALVMESDGTRITSIRAGVEPAVLYVEGCG